MYEILSAQMHKLIHLYILYDQQVLVLFRNLNLPVKNVMILRYKNFKDLPNFSKFHVCELSWSFIKHFHWTMLGRREFSFPKKKLIKNFSGTESAGTILHNIIISQSSIEGFCKSCFFIQPLINTIDICYNYI